MRTPSLLWLGLAAAFGAASVFSGCSDSTPDPKTAPPPAPTMTTPAPTMSAPPVVEAPKEEPKKMEEPPPPPPKKTAKDVIMPGAVFMLSFDDSADVKKMAMEPCAKKKKDDEKKKCEDDAKAAAMGEGVRFEKDEKTGNWVWVSFGKEKDKEVVYNKILVKDPKWDGDNKVSFVIAGKDSGKRPLKVKEGEMSPVTEMVDENTIAMTDPKRGRLVYKKKM